MIMMYNVKRHLFQESFCGWEPYLFFSGLSTEDTLDPHGTTSNLEDYFSKTLQENLSTRNTEGFPGWASEGGGA